MACTYICAARVYMRTGSYGICIPMSFKGRRRIQIKTKRKMSMFLLEQNFIFFPMNGVLGFDVSLLLCTGKWSKLFTEALLALNLHFQHLGLNLQENQVHHSKDPKILV